MTKFDVGRRGVVAILSSSWLAGLMWVASGCGGAVSETATPPPAAQTEASESAGEAERAESGATGSQRAAEASSHGPQLVVQGLGSEPRQRLRYQPAVGDEYTSRVVMRLENQMEIAGRAISGPPTTMTYTTLSRIASADAEGFRSDWSIEGFDIAAELEPEALQAARAEVQAFNGLRGWTRFTNRGEELEYHVELPEGISDALRAKFEETKCGRGVAGFFVPDEAVGPGAQWTVTEHLTNQGIALVQTTRLTLESVDQHGWSLTQAVEITAPPQEMNSPDPQMQLTLDSMSGHGPGTLSVGRNSQVESSGEVVMQMQVQMSQGSREMRMNSTIRVSTSVSVDTPEN